MMESKTMMITNPCSIGKGFVLIKEGYILQNTGRCSLSPEYSLAENIPANKQSEVQVVKKPKSLIKWEETAPQFCYSQSLMKC